MKEFNKIDCGEIKIGVRFSAPVFFDDGENMFLAEEKSAKPYHVSAISRWNIPYLLSYGHILSDDYEPSEGGIYDLEDAEELEEVEELADCEELEELA